MTNGTAPEPQQSDEESAALAQENLMFSQAVQQYLQQRVATLVVENCQLRAELQELKADVVAVDESI